MLGFMVSCAFLSMWLSNTSAAAMVMPIVEAVAQQITRAEAEADELELSCSNGFINPALELDGRRAERFCLCHPHSAVTTTASTIKWLEKYWHQHVLHCETSPGLLCVSPLMITKIN